MNKYRFVFIELLDTLKYLISDFAMWIMDCGIQLRLKLNRIYYFSTNYINDDTVIKEFHDDTQNTNNTKSQI